MLLRLAIAVEIFSGTGVASAQPGALHFEPVGDRDDQALHRERAGLERQLTWIKVGAAGAVGILVAGGIASYKTTTMCDAYPDPADDCGVVKGLATAGSIALVGLGAAATISAVVSWVSTERKLTIVNERLRPVVIPQHGGAMVGLTVRY